MKKNLPSLLLLLISISGYSQVDTTFIYNTTTPYGTLDIRIAKSATRYYYLQENKTFSFREKDGVKTNTYRSVNPWSSAPFSQGNMREKNGTSDIFVMNYRLLFPGGYQPTYSKGYPMIVMLHGAGESGNCWDSDCNWADRSWNPIANNPPAPTDEHHMLLNNDQNLSHGGRPHLEARNAAGTRLPDDPALSSRAFQGFMLFAQNLNGWETGSMHDVIRLIRLAVKKYNIDPNRIYLHGLSNGGIATYNVAKRAPWLFAAILPMSAPNDGGVFSANLQSTIAHIPIWTFQGGKDTAPAPFKTEGYVKRFREAGADVRYSLYPNLAHGTWNTAYDEPDFFSWMRSKSKTRLHVFFNNPAICGPTGAGVKMGFAAGFLAYQWQKDGVTISGATSHEYVATQPGVYRARFSRLSRTPNSTQWEEWSQSVTVTTSTPAKPTIIPLTTTHLRGPDNAPQNTIQLKSSTTNDKYFWYKNNVRIDIPSNNNDDTVSVFTITSTSTTSNGAYKLVTKTLNDCPSPESSVVNLFFNNSAPLIADSNIPGSFRMVSVTGSTANLAWQDQSTVETGYEIWRKAPGQAFVFAGRTGPNAQSFTDKGLLPATTYDYKIRAVNNQGRSKYAPSDAVATNLKVTTQGDNVAPTAPTNLSVVRNTINSISLSWNASTDSNGIKNYVVYYGSQSVATPTDATTYTITGLPMNTNYNITVKAVDNANLFSPASNQISATTTVTGLWYGHSTGAWSDLDQITTWNSPEFTGWVPNFTLAPRTQEEFFNFEFTGYLYIKTGGPYYFYINSDDGSRLYIDGVQVVNFDGIHEKSTANGGFGFKSAAINLTAGPHDIRVIFFEDKAGQYLTVGYQGADTDDIRQYIPDEALTSGTGAAVNKTPVVALTSPTNNQQFTAPATITLQATASDQDGTVTKVEFYNGTVKLGEDLTSPYAYTWNSVGAGSYAVKAKAIDNDGASATATANITVSDGSPSACTGTGTVKREMWTGIPGTSIASIPVNSTPASTTQLSLFEGPTNVADSYGSRLSGYLCVPATGAYTFWIASNDNSELWLSTSESPANKVKIASVTGYTNVRQWTKYPTQQSSPINLVEGQRYYIEALHKEGSGSDHIAVGWRLPNGTLEQPIPGNRVSPELSAAALSSASTYQTMSAEGSETESVVVADEAAGDEPELDIYPNPAQSGDAALTITGNEAGDEAIETSIEVVRMTGEVIYAETTYCESDCGGRPITFNRDLSPGVYVVNVVRNGKRMSKRLLVK